MIDKLTAIAADLPARFRNARSVRWSAGDACAALALGFTVAAVVLVRRDLRR